MISPVWPARLDHLVTQDVCRADQRATEQRIGAVEASLAGLRSEHDQVAERAEQQRRGDQTDGDADRLHGGQGCAGAARHLGFDEDNDTVFCRLCWAATVRHGRRG
ncbi:hypothetical protein [Streptomyces sp. NPDC047718]|uniref:hypothetical protein n=1 Tax=Streptomyces sp. NPDC047718 TaxID=3155479 RepID=UPI0033D33029